MSYRAAVITVSDRCARGERADTSGPAVRALLEGAGYDVAYAATVPDDGARIQSELARCADELRVALVCTTGGTGFSPRDVTPEATLAVIDREARGLAEAMRAQSLRLTPRACLSRAVAGLRGRTLIVNLPGSERAAVENLGAILDAVGHGLDMLTADGPADCAAPSGTPAPSLDAWLREAKADPDAPNVGMYLTHAGVVRRTSRAEARLGARDQKPVTGMLFAHDPQKTAAAVAQTRAMPGVYYARVWLNEGELKVGDDLMRVLVGADVRPHAVDALQFLVGKLKADCVTETERT